MAFVSKPAVQFFANILVIVLTVINVIGLVWLTKFAFKGKSNTLLNQSVTCVEGIDNTQLTFSKVAVVTLWLQITVSVALAVWTSVNNY